MRKQPGRNSARGVGVEGPSHVEGKQRREEAAISSSFDLVNHCGEKIRSRLSRYRASLPL